MIIVYIKENRFFKNVDDFGNVFEIQYPTREVVSENGEIITETYDNYIENGFTKVELPLTHKDVEYEDFNEDLTFNIEKYNARKKLEGEAKYEDLIVSKIRERYSINQELAILRQRDSKPIEYQEYYNYVEKCKAEAKEVLT